MFDVIDKLEELIEYIRNRDAVTREKAIVIINNLLLKL